MNTHVRDGRSHVRHFVEITPELRGLLESIAAAAIDALDQIDGDADVEDGADPDLEDGHDREDDDSEHGYADRDSLDAEDCMIAPHEGFDGTGHRVARNMLRQHARRTAARLR